MRIIRYDEGCVPGNGAVDKLVVVWIILYKVEPEKGVNKFYRWCVQ